MSSFVLEILSKAHDRTSFDSGLESVDRYLKETARGHTEKSVSITRVFVESNASVPKPIVGYFTLSTISVDVTEWPGLTKGLPKQPFTAVLLGRLAVNKTWQGKKIGERLMGLARLLALQTLESSGGIGMVVDAANEEVIGFYEKLGFHRISPGSHRMFQPLASLRM